MTHRQMERDFSRELKPCPFCGSKAIIVQWRDTQLPNATWAECKKCDIQGKTFYHKEPVKAIAKAVKVWNRRTSK